MSIFRFHKGMIGYTGVIMEVTNESIEERFKKGIALRDEDRFVEAIDEFLRITSDFPDHPRIGGVYILIGHLFSQLNDQVKSLEFFQKAVSLNPKSEHASIGSYLAYVKLKRFEEALEEIIRFLTGNKANLYKVTLEELLEDAAAGNIPQYEDAIIELALKNDVVPEDTEWLQQRNMLKALEQRFDNAVELREQGYFKESADAFLSIIKDSPDHPNVGEIYEYAGLAFLRMPDNINALKCFQNAAKANPDSEIASLGLHLSYGNLGEHEEAVEEVIKFLNDHPADLYKPTLEGLLDDIAHGDFPEYEKAIIELALKNDIFPSV